MFRYLIVGFCVGYVIAYPEGAPESACGNLSPQHGADVKPNPGYTIAYSQPNNGVYTVTLNAPRNTSFKGFIIQAFDSRDGKTTVGQFAAPNGPHSKLICNGAGVTHTERNPLTSVQLQWQGTPGTKVYFKATVVVKYDEIYGDIVSGEFTV
ncbi:defense protein l(2)34Fc-like [Macrobrachium rosenbergii]|uniref:defense protein l(2)34Fc-like n=1 Tax=Macrobrachium rosenbergii TaxID=79674 RepID=UPI0034D7154B